MTDDVLDWLNPQVQAPLRRRAQSTLDPQDEQMALSMVALYRDYEFARNRSNDEERKAECEKIDAAAAEIGQTLCSSGGAKRMLLVSLRAQTHLNMRRPGGDIGMRTIELWWNGICGWQA